MHDPKDGPGPDLRRTETPAPPDELSTPVAETDDAAASEARARFRSFGLEPVVADDQIRSLLDANEQVLAVRHSVGVDRRLGSSRASAIDSIRCDLYVTTARLVLIGQEVISFDLEQVEDSALAGESVLLLLHDGVGIVLDADRPRLLRVQIAAARTARAASGAQARDRLQPTSR